MFRKRRSSTAYRVILVALVIALGVSLMPSREARAAGGTTALVTCSSDDVKTAPDIYAQTIATYYQNQTVTVTGERTADGIWARVVLPDGRLGWMKVVCVAGTPEQPAPPSVPTGHTVRINTGALNVRTGPDVGYPAFTSISNGTTVTLLARNAASTWVKVILRDGRQGWVNASFLILNVSINSLPVSNL